MNVLHINLEFDCAGVSWNLVQAINEETESRAVHTMLRPTFAARRTHRQFKKVEEVVKMAEEADVLHFNQWIWTHIPGHRAIEFVPENEYGGTTHPFSEVLHKKAVIFHFHGGNHQLMPDYWLDQCEAVGAKVFKCDPLCPIPGAKWMPNVLDIEPGNVMNEAAAFAVAIMGHLSDERRNNAQISKALNYAQIPQDSFGAIPRDEALKMRRGYQATIDNLTQGFVGMWAWEGLAMGQIVLARLAPATIAAYEALGDGQAPPIFNVANVDEAVECLRELQKNPERCSKIAHKGTQWMARHYTPRTIARLYTKEYSHAQNDLSG